MMNSDSTMLESIDLHKFEILQKLATFFEICSRVTKKIIELNLIEKSVSKHFEKMDQLIQEGFEILHQLRSEKFSIDETESRLLELGNLTGQIDSFQFASEATFISDLISSICDYVKFQAEESSDTNFKSHVCFDRCLYLLQVITSGKQLLKRVDETIEFEKLKLLVQYLCIQLFVDFEYQTQVSEF